MNSLSKVLGPGRSKPGRVWLLALSIWLLPLGATHGDGPVVELPPEVEEEERDVVTRGMRQVRLESPSPIGGYGEMHLNVDFDGKDTESTIDLHRMVVFLSHSFDQSISLYTEIEVEHALVGDGLPGQVGVEQAFVDYRFLQSDSPVGELGVRAGIVLVPMGIINQWHEPPIFHGVERPMVDKNIIPTTWREGGIGLVGRPIPEVRFELYLLSGLSAGAFRTQDGLRKGRQAIAKAASDGLAVAGRLEFEPSPGVVIGLAGYAGQAGPNMDDSFLPGGAEADLEVWVKGFSVDVRGRYAGLEARAEFATFYIDDTEKLRLLVDQEGESLGLDVGSQILGGYLELAYDVLHLVDVSHQLLPFVRLEYYDTVEDLSGRIRTPADDNLQVLDVVAGLSYRPIAQVVFKGDFIYRMFDGDAQSGKILNFGVGYMF